MIPYRIKKGQHRYTGSADGGSEYDMQDGDKTTVGTEITLFLNEDNLEFANEYRVREVTGKILFFQCRLRFPFQRECRTGI